MSPFDYVKSITSTKEDLYSTEEVFQKEYNPFIVNRALANSAQTILFADVMNQCSSLPSKLQYDFYRMGVPKQNKYAAWTKKESIDLDSELIQFVCEEMELSQTKAIEIIRLLGENVIKDISSRVYGGKTNGKSKA